jgi:hypothetical protein
MGPITDEDTSRVFSVIPDHLDVIDGRLSHPDREAASVREIINECFSPRGGKNPASARSSTGLRGWNGPDGWHPRREARGVIAPSRWSRDEA